MWHTKCNFVIIVAFFVPFTCTISTNSSEFETELKTTEQLLVRQARIMHLVKERRPPIMILKSRPVPYTHTNILSRNDHYPMRHIPIPMNPMNNNNNNNNNNHNNKRHPIARRVQGPVPYPYESVKNTRYQALKTGLGYLGKPSIHREYTAAAAQATHTHPNALSQTFKASPHFSGQAIVRPVYELLGEAQKPQVDTFANLPVQQYPLPQETPQRSPPLSYLNQQEQFLAQPVKSQQQQQLYHTSSTFYEKYPKEEKQVRHRQQQQQYAVYEEPELTADHVTTVKFANAAEAKEALEFIQFMGSDAYFLPKHEPDYRVLDVHRDRQKQYNLQQQHQQQQQQQQQQKHTQQLLEHEYAYQSAAAATAEKAPKISQLIYSEPTLPRSSHIVQGSYQTGKNIFVVNSDGNKAVKHIVSSTPHTLPIMLESTRYAPTIRRRTPEPLRFEFTEQDAVVKAFTSDPNKRHNYVSSTARPIIENSISFPRVTSAGSSGYHHRGTADDLVDADDIQHLHAELPGHVSLGSKTTQVNSVSSTPPSQQKDTEDYCERICAYVQDDDDDEIICGSDGYMYTSKAQMECYASCLHLDVKITGKGSCTAR